MSSVRAQTPLEGLGALLLPSRGSVYLDCFSVVCRLHFNSPKLILISCWEHITLDPKYEKTVIESTFWHNAKCSHKRFRSHPGLLFPGWSTAVDITSPFGGKGQGFSRPAHPSRPSLSSFFFVICLLKTLIHNVSFGTIGALIAEPIIWSLGHYCPVMRVIF